MTEADVRQALRDWVQNRAGADAPLITDSTELIASRLITSLQVMDLLLFLEELRQEPVDPSMLRAGTFRNIDAIYATFFEPRNEQDELA